mgnify:CR=1 FL=1
MDTPKIYFPNLNGLRFIAAFLVIIHHIEQIKSIFKLENYWNVVPFIGVIGKLGVVLLEGGIGGVSFANILLVASVGRPCNDKH